MTGALLALALAAGPALAASPPLAQEDWEAPPYGDEEDEDRPHLYLSAWAGEAYDPNGERGSATVLGGEAAWAFDRVDLGIAGYGYRGLPGAERDWTPVALLRVTQRFRMRSGVEAAFGLGLGAGRPGGWEGWFQVALGVRVPLGPLFLGGELAFERGDLLRLAAGLGLAF